MQAQIHSTFCVLGLLKLDVACLNLALLNSYLIFNKSHRNVSKFNYFEATLCLSNMGFSII